MHDRNFLLTPQKGEAKRSQHKNNRDHRRKFGQKRGSPGAAEDRLAGAPKRRADSCPLAVLQEHDGNQGNAYYHMDDNDNCSHDLKNINKGFARRKPFCCPGIDTPGSPFFAGNVEENAPCAL
jgi:hypothetical protein